MTTKQEKQRRRKIVRELNEQRWIEAEKKRPIQKDDLAKLFDFLYVKLFEKLDDGRTWCYCDKTLAKSREFLISQELPEEKVEQILEWFGEYGGFCDCEVYSNVGEAWQDRL